MNQSRYSSVQHGRGKVVVRFSTVQFSFSTVAVRLWYGAVLLRYGAILLRYGCSTVAVRLRYGFSTVQNGCVTEADNIISKLRLILILIIIRFALKKTH